MSRSRIDAGSTLAGGSSARNVSTEDEHAKNILARNSHLKKPTTNGRSSAKKNPTAKDPLYISVWLVCFSENGKYFGLPPYSEDQLQSAKVDGKDWSNIVVIRFEVTYLLERTSATHGLKFIVIDYI